MHIGSTDGTTGPVPVRGAKLAVVEVECQKLSRLYRLGLAGSTAVCKITAVVPLVLPASDRRALAKLAVKCLHFISSQRLYRLGLAGSSGPAGIAWFWSRWLNASGCTAGAPVQPVLRDLSPTASFFVGSTPAVVPLGHRYNRPCGKNTPTAGFRREV